jgi:hypothetical protein
MLRQENARLAQQVEMLHSRYQTTQQHLTQAQQMLHGMQERSDRLMEGPRPAPAPERGAAHPVTAPEAIPLAWQRIIDYVRSVNRAVTPAEVQQALALDRTPRHRMHRMGHRGILQCVAPGTYGLAG